MQQWTITDEFTSVSLSNPALSNFPPKFHWRNFTLKSGDDQWHRRHAEGASIEANVLSGVEHGEGCPLPSRLEGLEELPQRDPGRSPGRYRIFCIFRVTERFW